MASGGDKPFLPYDIIVNILKRLPVKFIVQFRCVCKYWKNLIKTPHFIVEQARHSGHHEEPLLLLLENNCEGTSPYLHLLNHEMKTVEVLSIPSVDCFKKGWRIIGSCNGLLCVEVNLDIETSPRSLCVWNPLIREVRQIPSPEGNNYLCPCDFGFGFSSIINDFKILIFYNQKILNKKGYYKKKNASLLGDHRGEVYSLSTGSWKELVSGGLKSMKIISDCVSVDGTILWVGVQDFSPVVVSFDIATEVFTLTPIPITSVRRDLRLKIMFDVYQNKYAIVRNCCNLSFTILKIWVMEEVADGESAGKSFSCIKEYVTANDEFVFSPVCIWRNKLVCQHLSCHLETLNLTTEKWEEFDNYSSEHICCGGFNYEWSLVSVWNTQVD